MQPKHTPGPWTPSFGRGQHGHAWHDATVYVAPDIFDEIAICPERLVFGPDGNGDETLSRLQVEANARLIAAAPDLLEALRQIAAMERLPIGSVAEEMSTRLRAAQIARAAIAKAEGGSDVA
jgi:hypothetical protein